VVERRFLAVAAQAHVRLDEDILNELFMGLNVTAESPHYFGDVPLVPFDEAAIRIGIALPALADVIDVASGGDGLVCADCQSPEEARDAADRLG
jgi:hypothetical protein